MRDNKCFNISSLFLRKSNVGIVHCLPAYCVKSIENIDIYGVMYIGDTITLNIIQYVIPNILAGSWAPGCGLSIISPICPYLSTGVEIPERVHKFNLVNHIIQSSVVFNQTIFPNHEWHKDEWGNKLLEGVWTRLGTWVLLGWNSEKGITNKIPIQSIHLFSKYREEWNKHITGVVKLDSNWHTGSTIVVFGISQV